MGGEVRHAEDPPTQEGAGLRASRARRTLVPSEVPMIWLLVPLLVLLTLPLWLRDAFSHEVDWWLMWFTAAALASAALLAPSVWVGMGLAWLAIVPLSAYFGALRKILR